MPTAKPFSWVVRFTVAPLWVQDGFTISNDRALSMLARAVGGATGEELQAQVLESPSPLQIASMQGYTKHHPGAGRVVRELIGQAGHGQVRKALIKARDILNSVAYVAKEGDTAEPLRSIHAALDSLDTRAGDPVEIEV